MEGSHTNFSCRPGYELIGLHSAVYMGNGEWVPDPQEFEINCSSWYRYSLISPYCMRYDNPYAIALPALYFAFNSQEDQVSCKVEMDRLMLLLLPQ